MVKWNTRMEGFRNPADLEPDLSQQEIEREVTKEMGRKYIEYGFDVADLDVEDQETFDVLESDIAECLALLKRILQVNYQTNHAHHKNRLS
ncbi:MAG: hypothetical protein O3B64_04140 [bacterium]|nr:hypothetical protein [bacterium]